MLNMIESWLDSYQSTLTNWLDFTGPCSPFIPTQAFREVAEGLTSYALGDHTDDIEWGSMCFPKRFSLQFGPRISKSKPEIMQCSWKICRKYMRAKTNHPKEKLWETKVAHASCLAHHSSLALAPGCSVTASGKWPEVGHIEETFMSTLYIYSTFYFYLFLISFEFYVP